MAALASDKHSPQHFSLLLVGTQMNTPQHRIRCWARHACQVLRGAIKTEPGWPLSFSAFEADPSERGFGEVLREISNMKDGILYDPQMLVVSFMCCYLAHCCAVLDWGIIMPFLVCLEPYETM